MEIGFLKITEDQLQAQCVAWFRLRYPGKVIYAIPNGEKREQKTYVNKSGKTKTWSPAGTRLKKLGVLAGVPDLCIPVVRTLGGHFLRIGLYVELKVDNNKLSKEQLEIRDKLISQYYQYDVCYTFDDFVKCVKEYFGDN